MPLTKGKSRAVIKHNIDEMIASGHPVKQAVAAALSTAKYKRKKKKVSVKGRNLGKIVANG
jgi:hypothetical protein